MRGSSCLLVVAAASGIFFQAPAKPGALTSPAWRAAPRSGDVVALQRAGLTLVDGPSYARWATRQPADESRSMPAASGPRRDFPRRRAISSFVAVMFSLTIVIAAKAFGAVVRRPQSTERPAPSDKTAMLSIMGSGSSPRNASFDLKEGALKPRLERLKQDLLDDKVFRTAELNRARLCTIFCLAMSTQPVMDRAETLMVKLFQSGDQEEWGRLLSLIVFLSWGPILDSLNSNALESRKKDSAVASFEFDPLSLNEPSSPSKVRRRMKAIERQFDRPAKLAIFLYLLEIVFANTSMLRESRMAIAELQNVLMHEGDLQVLLEKSTAACLQVGCNVADIGHDVGSISDKFEQFFSRFDRA